MQRPDLRCRTLPFVFFCAGLLGGCAPNPHASRPGPDASRVDDDSGMLVVPTDPSRPLPEAGSPPMGDAARDAGSTRSEAGAKDARVDPPAVPDAGAAPGGSACTAHTYKLCEDFESATVGALPAGWTIAAGWDKGTPAVTDAEHHGGTKALHGAIAISGQPRVSRSLTGLGASAGKHWGRIFYKVKSPASLPESGVIHGTLVGLKGSTESRVVDTVVNTQGKHQFLYNVPDDSCCKGSSYDYASYDGRWHCAEWYVDADTQTFRFFFEGTEVKSIGFSYGADKRLTSSPTAQWSSAGSTIRCPSSLTTRPGSTISRSTISRLAASKRRSATELWRCTRHQLLGALAVDHFEAPRGALVHGDVTIFDVEPPAAQVQLARGHVLAHERIGHQVLHLHEHVEL
jgi:hypothetical protein